MKTTVRTKELVQPLASIRATAFTAFENLVMPSLMGICLVMGICVVGLWLQLETLATRHGESIDSIVKFGAELHKAGDIEMSKAVLQVVGPLIKAGWILHGATGVVLLMCIVVLVCAAFAPPLSPRRVSLRANAVRAGTMICILGIMLAVALTQLEHGGWRFWDLQDQFQQLAKMKFGSDPAIGVAIDNILSQLQSESDSIARARQIARVSGFLLLFFGMLCVCRGTRSTRESGGRMSPEKAD